MLFDDYDLDKVEPLETIMLRSEHGQETGRDNDA